MTDQSPTSTDDLVERLAYSARNLQAAGYHNAAIAALQAIETISALQAENAELRIKADIHDRATASGWKEMKAFERIAELEASEAIAFAKSLSAAKAWTDEDTRTVIRQVEDRERANEARALLAEARVAVLEAENAALRRELAGCEADMEVADARIASTEAENVTLRSARDEAIRLMTENARAAGEGKLEALEMTGVVEGWIERAGKLEGLLRRVARDLEAVSGFQPGDET